MLNEPMTLREIAEREGISKERVSQILESAMKKFVKACLEKGIKVEDLL